MAVSVWNESRVKRAAMASEPARQEAIRAEDLSPQRISQKLKR